LLTHGGVILDHPKIATVSTKIATVVEDISIPVALTKTVPQADNARLACGRTHATTKGQNKRKVLHGAGIHVFEVVKGLAQRIMLLAKRDAIIWKNLCQIGAIIGTHMIMTMMEMLIMTQTITTLTLRRKAWAFMEPTSARQETVASTIAKQTMTRNRGMLA